MTINLFLLIFIFLISIASLIISIVSLNKSNNNSNNNISNKISDATTTTKGIIKLAGDLSGTADAPLVPGLGSKANLNSPDFTGIPTAPTALPTDDSKQIATTAFVKAAIAAALGP